MKSATDYSVTTRFLLTYDMSGITSALIPQKQSPGASKRAQKWDRIFNSLGYFWSLYCAVEV